MDQHLHLRIILQSPPTGVEYGIQQGNGSQYATILKQKSKSGDLEFEFPIQLKFKDPSSPNFLGPVVQGPKQERFIYIDIGQSAGQMDSVWSRRLKIPLRDITTEMIHQLIHDPDMILEANVSGTAKDGGPNCGTVKPFTGWHLVNRNTRK
jgi:hypothetical protein